MRVLAIYLALIGFSAVAAAKSAPIYKGKVVIQVDLDTRWVRIDKFTKKGHKQLLGRTLPVVKESFHAGRFRPLKGYEKFRSVNGNVYLENLVLFDGNRAIRTTRLYDTMKASGQPVSNSIVVEAEIGQILFDTIRDYGRANTEIHILKK